MGPPFDIERYLDRIAYRGARVPSPQALAELQEAHLLAVPFENLDIHRGEPIVLEEASLFDKIVTRRRGGFCYELNGLFARLLEAMGYPTSRVSARVFGAGGALSPPHDHLALLVACEGRWLVDVGFGEAFVRPLDIDDDRPVQQRLEAHRVTRREGSLIYASRAAGAADFSDQYAFTEEPRSMADFQQRCAYHQTSPQSHFTQKRVITRLTPIGRVTLRDRQLIVTEGSVRTEHPVADEAAWRSVLARDFGVLGV